MWSSYWRGVCEATGDGTEQAVEPLWGWRGERLLTRPATSWLLGCAGSGDGCGGPGGSCGPRRPRSRARLARPRCGSALTAPVVLWTTAATSSTVSPAAMRSSNTSRWSGDSYWSGLHAAVLQGRNGQLLEALGASRPAVLHREGGRLQPGVHLQLRLDVLEVDANRSLTSRFVISCCPWLSPGSARPRLVGPYGI
jgi:hypothetical protein